MRTDRQRIRDILRAIEQIESEVSVDEKDSFQSDEKLQVWVVHHLQIIGEACRKLSDKLKRQHPELPWKQIIGMRHYLVHEYFRVDINTTWNVVVNDLSDLRTKIEAIEESFDSQ